MSAYRDANEALGALEGKLQELNGMMRANGFLVGVMLQQGDALKQMGAEEARAMLRERAQAEYGPGSNAPDEALLEVLEEVLGTARSAEVIPFPQRG